jgi:hypothetical protein
MLTEKQQPVEPQTAAILTESFVACEEDRPVPLKIDLSKPLTLLDTDAELLSSFERLCNALRFFGRKSLSSRHKSLIFVPKFEFPCKAVADRFTIRVISLTAEL